MSKILAELLSTFLGLFRFLFGRFADLVASCGRLAAAGVGAVGSVAGAVAGAGAGLVSQVAHGLAGWNYGAGGAAATAEHDAAAGQRANQRHLEIEEKKAATMEDVRRACTSRAAGQEISGEVAGRLQKTILAYLSAITPAECGALAALKGSDLRGFLECRATPAGVRSPAEVSQTIRASLPPAAVRQGDSVDEIMAVYEAAAARLPAAPTPEAAPKVVPFIPAPAPLAADGRTCGAELRVKNAIRVMSGALARGVPVPEDAAARVPAALRDWLEEIMDRDECAAVAKCKPAALSGLLTHGAPPPGVRAPHAENVVHMEGYRPRVA